MSENKGGRVAQKNAIYFSSPAQRDGNLRLAKKKFGSLAIDVHYLACERMCSSDFFLLHLSPKFFQLIEQEDGITKDEFTTVISYCTKELQMYDAVLYEHGYLFSISFLRFFEAAGLFRNRKYKANDILRCANHFRPGVAPLTLEDELEIIANSENRPSQPAIKNNPVDFPDLKPKKSATQSDSEDLPF